MSIRDDIPEIGEGQLKLLRRRLLELLPPLKTSVLLGDDLERVINNTLILAHNQCVDHIRNNIEGYLGVDALARDTPDVRTEAKPINETNQHKGGKDDSNG